MGKNGSKWKHGYIPENAAATALKMHRKPGGHGTAGGRRKAAGPPKLRTGTVPRATGASEREGTRGIKKQPKPKSPPKVKNPGGRNMQDLSVPGDIAKVKGTAKPRKKAKGTLTSSQVRRGLG